MNIYRHLTGPVLAAFSLATGAMAQAPDMGNYSHILSCSEQAINSVDVPEGTLQANPAFTKIWKGVRAHDPDINNNGANFVGVEATIVTDYLQNGDRFDYGVVFQARKYNNNRNRGLENRVGAENYSGDAVSLGSMVTFTFNTGAEGDVTAQNRVYDGTGTDTPQQEQDLVQLANATDMMGMIFTDCMNMPLYKLSEGISIVPPRYFPSF